MRVSRPLFVAAVFLGAAATQLMNAQTNQPDEGKDKEPVAAHLQRISKDNGVYFTLEETIENPSDENGSVLSRRVTRNAVGPAASSLESRQVITGLQPSLPGVTLRQGIHHPNVIHAGDGRLAKEPGYALDRVVPDIDFNGTAGQLLEMLQHRDIAIAPELWGVIGDPLLMGNALSSSVRVKGTNLTVREILSEAAMSSGHKWLLWVASARSTDKGRTTFIRFPGPEIQAPKQ